MCWLNEWTRSIEFSDIYSIPRTLQLIKNKFTSIFSSITTRNMFEAKLLEGNILKKIVEAIKDVVSDVNIDVSPSGKWIQKRGRSSAMR